MSFFSKLKAVEHVFALVGTAAMTFIVSPAGQAIVHQYPVLAPITSGLAFLLAYYHTPSKI
jgi:hypothetical protein